MRRVGPKRMLQQDDVARDRVVSTEPGPRAAQKLE